MSNTHVFTSCTNNYLPLARVLLQSVKQFNPDFYFHLVLCDRIDKSIDLKGFDNVITIEDFSILNLQKWLFKHSVVELCTAVKGLAFKHIINNYQCDHVLYLDPDIAVFSPLDELISNFEDNDILITPHQLQPETSTSDIINNEISFLRHGTFNLGFLGVKNAPEGREFLNWWANRCLQFCYSDSAFGLYTDQRWIDLAPSFFTSIKILRNPAYNVATWNLNKREIKGNLDTKILVNGQPLCFYHFSSSQSIMLETNDLYNETTLSLMQWYQEKCQEMGKAELSQLSCVYNFFDNGEVIPDEARRVYRQWQELEEIYPNPFSEEFYQWCLNNEQLLKEQNPHYVIEKLADCQLNLDNTLAKLADCQLNLDNVQDKLATTKQQLAECKELVQAMESSKFWKIRTKWIKLKEKLTSPIIRFLKQQKELLRQKYIDINIQIFDRLKFKISSQYPPQVIQLPQSYYQRKPYHLNDLAKIAIVTPSYNQAEFIEDTIKSILDQNYPNLEYIIQDGNSQDGTSEIVNKYQDYLQFNCESDQGQANAINKGFAKSSGEIMAWLNSDDILLPGALFYVSEYFKNHPEVDVIYSHRIVINDKTEEIARWLLAPHDNKVLSWADYIPQETMFWRRRIWEKVDSQIDESFQFAMDWDLILRFREAGAVFQRIPRFLGAFRVYERQKTQSWNNKGQEEMNSLRYRCHGYIPDEVENLKNLNKYLIRCSFHHQLYSLNQIISNKISNNYEL